MLNKKYRFHSRGGVRNVYRTGKTIRNNKMSLVFVDNPRNYTRVAVVISKKVEKSAVDRNRVRRRIYEIIRKNFDLLPKNKDYIFVVYSHDVIKMKASELEKSIGELVKDSKI